jgi:hypothetical protein
MTGDYLDVVAIPTEEMRDPTLCYGVPGKSVWYCRECERMLDSNKTPHLKPLPHMPVQVVPLRHKRTR